MADESRAILEFYDRHPISAPHILAKLEAERGGLEGLASADLYPHDQDHYGGLAANAALAARAEIGPGAVVVDFCAGLGGPARWMAAERGARVIGVELNPGRAEGARALTSLAGLADRVEIRQGDVQAAPVEDAIADAVVSQEAFLHLPDKPAALAEALRILKPGGRLAFTDWIRRGALSEEEETALRRGIAAQALNTAEDYRAQLAGAGFELVSEEDLTAEWAAILAERLEMYRELRVETERVGAASGDDAFYETYERFVALVQAGRLGGARFTAARPG